MTAKSAKWIWLPDGESEDSYADFALQLPHNTAGEIKILISADSDYVLRKNGEYLASGQYGDLPHYKIYDEIYTKVSEGTLLTVTVHHTGYPTSRYYPAEAGLWVEVYSEEELIYATSERTLCRKSPTYRSGLKKLVTNQLGFSLTYDIEGEEREGGWCPAAVCTKEVTLFPRPIKKHTVCAPIEPKSIRHIDRNTVLVDLGREAVGLCTLSFSARRGQHLTVSWGEHIDDGKVRAEVGGRRFTFDLYAKEGENRFTEYMLRLGARYLEISSDESFCLHYLTIMPTVYEARPRTYEISDPTLASIYSICERTLSLCMMEHYVDCPWREQALYAFDSRNQMLSGYYAFEGGNKEYARASLKLLSEDRDKGTLLSICSPSANELAIPSFSLHYIVAMEEYATYTSDLTLAEEYMPRLISIADHFLSLKKDGVICPESRKSLWNFYDWSSYADGTLGKADDSTPDLFINCLALIALSRLDRLRKMLSLPPLFKEATEELKAATRAWFLAENGLFTARRGKEQFTELGASLAILSGVAEGFEEKTAEAIVSGKLIPASLSCKVFVYDALLSVDRGRYSSFVLSSIKESYAPMVELGNGTVWETAEGASAFHNAGSLCHGWSAIPIYFLHLLGEARYTD